MCTVNMTILLAPSLQKVSTHSVGTMSLKLQPAYETPGDLVKVHVRNQKVRWNFCVGTKLPDAAEAAGPRTTL